MGGIASDSLRHWVLECSRLIIGLLEHSYDSIPTYSYVFLPLSVSLFFCLLGVLRAGHRRVHVSGALLGVLELVLHDVLH